jgi:hypothetical protein
MAGVRLGELPNVGNFHSFLNVFNSVATDAVSSCFSNSSDAINAINQMI